MKDNDVYSHLTYFCNRIVFCVYIYVEQLLGIKKAIFYYHPGTFKK